MAKIGDLVCPKCGGKKFVGRQPAMIDEDTGNFIPLDDEILKCKACMFTMGKRKDLIDG